MLERRSIAKRPSDFNLFKLPIAPQVAADRAAPRDRDRPICVAHPAAATIAA
jgi:hypothetical protein